ncbi:AAA family ATPase [Burkholderia cenocepacia]|uniref:AAA family ATPase n=1 Tax=Burkholderia cenocepacia TaxID=95486 RepID=UPI000981CCED|nr:AAA family ATPase [Burkholderia cenocepacia]AQQ36330.1 hypothetical protein A8E96_30325 [Burkholderia cenocepacia]MBR8078718.1 AAA family ATPase [Burkholderia cenocepacia]ONW25792.1 hypothetical protein A8E95_31215 [Burkholderia cenocepacia]
MKIEALNIRNFRGIRSAVVRDLGNMVVIAGQNGSGKSCVLDAIRLLKSVYGGYQQNEWHQWMGEFQINFSNRNDLVNLLNTPDAELRITCEFTIHSDERAYITANCEDLVRQSIWRSRYPELYAWSSFRAVSLAAHLRDHEHEIREQTELQVAALVEELKSGRIIGEFVLPVGQPPHVRPSKILEIIFGTFRPSFLGVIDYHGPHRMYGRETLQGINLNLDAIEQQKSQHALYNYINKYANVKSEMAASYIKEVLANEAGNKAGEGESLSNTLKELFRTFFPDKEFLGPQPTPDGTLAFPVRTADGATHDLNELSAGEKEVLYGYLRLRNSAPRFSVILLDEPELHLNPRLIKGLPHFYHRHLGFALDNQIWLITHSDALLREAVGHEGYSVFHMQGATVGGDEQLTPLLAKEGLERAVIDLVGDLAAYRPNAKLVIFEGENSEFDQRMTNSLFPLFQQAVNTISAGSKQRVRGLHGILDAALEKGQIPMKIFSIVDSDNAAEASGASAQSFAWDVYHIENYLIEAKFILKVVRDLGVSKFQSEEDVYVCLRTCAQDSLADLIRHRMASEINKRLVGSIDLSTDPRNTEIAPLLAAAIARSKDRLCKIAAEDCTVDKLSVMEANLKLEFEKALAADTWRKKFMGRSVLRRFAEQLDGAVKYETLRNLIIASMRDAGFQPPGMHGVITKILTA